MCARKSGDKRKAAKEFPTAAIIKKSAAEIETHIESGSMGRMRDLGLRRLRIQLGYKLLAPNNRVMNGFAFLGSGTFFFISFLFRSVREVACGALPDKSARQEMGHRFGTDRKQ